MDLWQAVGAILGVLSPIICAMLVFYLQRAQKKRDVIEEARANERKREARLLMDLVMADARLTVGTALAIKRGVANGEMEDGLAACKAARKAYLDFINECYFEGATD